MKIVIFASITAMGIILLAISFTLLFQTVMQEPSPLIASIGWHGLASIGWNG